MSTEMMFEIRVWTDGETNATGVYNVTLDPGSSFLNFGTQVEPKDLTPWVCNFRPSYLTLQCGAARVTADMMGTSNGGTVSGSLVVWPYDSEVPLNVAVYLTVRDQYGEVGRIMWSPGQISVPFKYSVRPPES